MNHTNYPRLVSTIIFAITLFVTSAAHAFLPASGMWWNPAEPGKGYNFEFQNEKVFVSIFAYDAGGKGKFFTAAGDFNATSRSFSNTLLEVDGGSCLGCPPGSVPSTKSLGTVTVTWTDAGTATMVLPNGTRVPIRPFNIGYANGVVGLNGGWFLGYAIGSSTFAERYVCGSQLDRDGFIPCRSASGRAAAAGTDSQIPGASLIVDVDSAGKRVNAFLVYQFNDRLAASYLSATDQIYGAQGWQILTSKDNPLTSKSLTQSAFVGPNESQIEVAKQSAMLKDKGAPASDVELDAFEALTEKLVKRLQLQTK